jgi:putative sterol carrier protein
MGKYFKISDEFYKVYVPYFEKLLKNPDVGGKISEKQLTVQFFITDLKAQLLLDCCDPKGQVVCGETEKEGDIKIWLKSDSAHRLWSGKLALMPAIMSREIRVMGPADKLKELSHIFKPASEIYQTHIKEHDFKALMN